MSGLSIGLSNGLKRDRSILVPGPGPKVGGRDLGVPTESICGLSSTDTVSRNHTHSRRDKKNNSQGERSAAI